LIRLIAQILLFMLFSEFSENTKVVVTYFDAGKLNDCIRRKQNIPTIVTFQNKDIMLVSKHDKSFLIYSNEKTTNDISTYFFIIRTLKKKDQNQLTLLFAYDKLQASISKINNKIILLAILTAR
jgi:hypothetical protein